MATWKEVAISDMRIVGHTGSYASSYAPNTAPPAGRRANGNSSSAYLHALLVMGRYPNDAAFSAATNPDFGAEISWMSQSQIDDLASRTWGEVIIWNQVYFSDPWSANQPTGWINNTRVMCWDFQLWLKSASTGQWSRLTQATSWEGHAVSPPFDVEDFSGTYADYRTEADTGYGSVRLVLDNNAPYSSDGYPYWAYHGYAGGVRSFNANDVADVVVTQKMSLIKHSQSAADDRDYTRLALAVGADYYPTPRNYNYPSVGASKHKLVSAKWPDWEFVVMHTLTEAQAALPGAFPPSLVNLVEGTETTTPPPSAPGVGAWFPKLTGGLNTWQTRGTSAATAPVWVTTSLPGAAVGTAYTYQLVVTGATSFSHVSGKPAWMTVGSNGALSGTPTGSATTHTVTLRATNATGNTDLAFSLSVGVAPTIITTTLPSAVQNVAYYQILAADQTATWSVASGTLPTGITLGSTGILSGTPTGTGTSNFTVRATGSTGYDDQALSITVGAAGSAPVITTATLPAGTVGTAYSQTISATGSVTAWSLIDSLPTGLTFNTGTHVISGTPTVAETRTFTIRATNAYGYDDQTLSITVNATATSATYSGWARFFRK